MEAATLINLNVNSRPVRLPISGPPTSPSSAQDFPDTLFSSSTKCILSPPEMDLDEPFADRGKCPVQKRVHFSKQMNVKETLSRHDMSIDERCNYWIQRHEFNATRQRNNQSHSIEEDQDDFTQCMDHRSAAVVEIELRKDMSRRPSIDEYFYEQTDIYFLDIFEDDAFGCIYFEDDGKC